MSKELLSHDAREINSKFEINQEELDDTKHMKKIPNIGLMDVHSKP